jgi:hypothetical protein
VTTQLFLASTAYGLATVVSALDDGAFPAADRRILVVSNNAAIPETAHRIEDVAGLSRLLQRFDAVHDYNEVIAPQHPSLWRPRAADLPLLERYLTALWSVTDDVHLIVESVQVCPALALCRIFPDARIDVYADGLMSYGPTRNKLPALVSSRIERLLYLDLVPGLSPVLLTEFGVPPHIISTDAFRQTIDALDQPPEIITSADSREVAVLLGQYLSSTGILTVEEETVLHLDMVRGALAAGFRRLVFKPHPSSAPIVAEPLVAQAALLGAALVVQDSPELVETLFRSDAVGCVIGCFSTALMTAATCYGLPAARVGTDMLLDRLRPYQNSNRIPITIIDATLPDVSELAEAFAARLPAFEQKSPELTRLVGAVSYCMQPERYPQLRQVAAQLLHEQFDQVRPYFKRRRLTLLDLPGRLLHHRLVVPRLVRAIMRRVLGPTVSAQVGRMSRRIRCKGLTSARSRWKPGNRLRHVTVLSSPRVAPVTPQPFV